MSWSSACPSSRWASGSVGSAATAAWRRSTSRAGGGVDRRGGRAGGLAVGRGVVAGGEASLARSADWLGGGAVAAGSVPQAAGTSGEERDQEPGGTELAVLSAHGR